MKKFISAIMLAFGVMNASAQLTVYNNGHTNVGGSLQTSNVRLSVGDVVYSDTAIIEVGQSHINADKMSSNIMFL